MDEADLRKRGRACLQGLRRASSFRPARLQTRHARCQHLIRKTVAATGRRIRTEAPNPLASPLDHGLVACYGSQQRQGYRQKTQGTPPQSRASAGCKAFREGLFVGAARAWGLNVLSGTVRRDVSPRLQSRQGLTEAGRNTLSATREIHRSKRFTLFIPGEPGVNSHCSLWVHCRTARTVAGSIQSALSEGIAWKVSAF